MQRKKGEVPREANRPWQWQTKNRKLFANSADFGSAHVRHKCIECTQNVHAICIIQLSEQSPSTDFIYTSDHLSESGKNRMDLLAHYSAKGLLFFACAQLIKDAPPQNCKLFTNSVDLDPLTYHSIIGAKSFC